MRWPWLWALQQPDITTGWTLAEWQEAIRQTRRLRLLARLGESIAQAGLLGNVPEPAAHLLQAERLNSAYRLRVVSWAATCIARSLGGSSGPLVLLKGSAYQAQALPISEGRLPSDLDMLVPRDALQQAQRALMADGWTEPELDDHDRRYYHEWSHEVPPMQHGAHPIELDLHHNILPPLGPVLIDMPTLLADCQPSGWPGWSVLSPCDQVLHSAAHLFFDAEPLERIRDIVDLDGLMRQHASGESTFWTTLLLRAERLGLMEPLLLGCHFCRGWLATPLPDVVEARLRATGLGHRLLRSLFAAALAPAPLDQARPLSQRLAVLLILWRYHFRRMPLRLLVPHLVHKLRSRFAG